MIRKAKAGKRKTAWKTILRQSRFFVFGFLTPLRICGTLTAAAFPIPDHLLN
jgi:hypothetical protein